MARLTLNDEAGIAFGDITVFGTSDGSEEVTIFSGAHVTLLGGFEQGGDTIHFDGDAADFTVSREGASIVFTGADGTEVTLPVSPNGETTVTFDDGTFAATIENGNVVIGDQVVTDTAEPVEGGSNGGGNEPPPPEAVELTTGADTILAGEDTGAGDDRINGIQNVNFPGKLLSSTDFVDGGAGFDTITLTNAYTGGASANIVSDSDFSGVQNVEALNTNYQSVTLGANAQDAGIRTVDMSEVPGGFGSTLNASAYTADLDATVHGNVFTGSGDDTVTTAFFDNGTISVGDGDDTIIEGDSFNVAAATIDGGAGNDTLELGRNEDAGVALSTGSFTETFDTSNMTGVENIVVRAGTDATVSQNAGAEAGYAQSYDITVDAASIAAGGTLTIDGSALRTDVIDDLGDDDAIGGTGANADSTSDETLTVDASGLAANQAVNATGGAGDDSFTGGAGKDTFTGGLGDDTLDGGAGIDVLQGGQGSDTYVYGAGEFVAGEALGDNGTSGTDTVVLNNVGTVTDAMFDGKSGIERLTVTGTGDVTIGENADATGIRFVNLVGQDLDATDYESDLRVNLSGTVAGSIELGSGDDTLNGGDLITGATVLDGGDGNDTLNLNGDYAGLVFTADFTNFETITVSSGDDGAAGTEDDAHSYNITLNDDNVGADGLTIDGSGLHSGVVTDFGADGAAGGGDDTTANETLTVNGGAVTGDLHLVGGASADSLTGGSGDDTISGGLGSDALQGGAGDDTVNGGDGVDTINGGAGDDVLSGGAGNDTITGGVGEDVINAGGNTGTSGDVIDLGNDGEHDLVTVTAGDSSALAFDTVSGFTIDPDGPDANGDLDDGHDALDFGHGLLTTTVIGVENGFVDHNSTFGQGVEGESTYFGAIQAIEQALDTDSHNNSGVLGFEYNGNTYVGYVNDATGTAAAFTDVVQVTGVTGVEQLVLDGHTATSLGLSA